MSGDLAAAWLSECWKPCPELPLHERVEKRKSDRRMQRELEERSLNTEPTVVHKTSTGNPEIDCGEPGENAA